MEFKVEKGWSYPSVDSGIIAFAWKSLINVVILHSKHQGADYCRTDQRKIISNFITADGLLQRKHLNLRTSNLFISVHAAAFLTPLCPSSVSLFSLPPSLRRWLFPRAGVSSGSLGESLPLRTGNSSTTTRTFGCCTWLHTPGRTSSMFRESLKSGRHKDYFVINWYMRKSELVLSFLYQSNQ